MRLSLRIISYHALLGIVATTFAACSSTRSMAPALVAPQQSQAFLRKALSLDAFPAAIDAFPASLGAFPVSLNAYAACQTQGTQAQCHTQWRSDLSANSNPATPPSAILGYQPNDLQNAYQIASQAASAGGDQTVGIVVAYHDPMLVPDLNVYRATFGLPACALGVTPPIAPVGSLIGAVTGILAPPPPPNGPPPPPPPPNGPPPPPPPGASNCLTISWANGNANGANYFTSTTPPIFNQGWAIEEELDAEMVSAICPNCSILIVEAQDASLQNLANAVTSAVSQHATEVSNSYSVRETPDMGQYAGHYHYKGVPITVSAGDVGYGPDFPATVATVTAVGGASLVQSNGTWGEAIWPGTGSGCSAFAKKPQWQTDRGCPNRTVNDLAVVADPATGVAGYVSYVGGWTVFGGTSVGAPIVAAMYALAENGNQINDASELYETPNSFAPITARSNGTCYPTYLCNGGPGYDGPSGLGMPIGLSAF